MNIDKIGKFISERRKTKKLTQEKLAEKKLETMNTILIFQDM